MAAALEIPSLRGRTARTQAEVEEILKRLGSLRQKRGVLDSHWQEIHDRLWPHSGDFTTRRTEGEKRTQELFDSTAANALEKFGAFLEASLTPRNQTWHRLRASVEEVNEIHEVREWFDQGTRILHKMRESPRANYYAQMHEGYKSLGAYGNSCLFVDEQPGGIRYRNIHIGQLYIVLDHHQQVDTVYRVYRQSAFAARLQWGEVLPPKIQQASEGDDPFKEFEWLHLVRRRERFDPESPGLEGKRFDSIYIAIEDKALVHEGGFHENPYKYSRFTVNPTETYGRGPAMLILPHAKTANEMQKTFLRAGHKVVDPPLLAHSDGVLGSGGKQINLKPGGINYGGLDVQGRELLKPLQTGARLDLTEGMLERERAAIEQAFFVQFFRAFLEHPNMTATQVMALLREKGEQLGPVAGRQQSEILGPQIEREMKILLRQGLLPPMPDALVEIRGSFEIEYDSPATRFQRAAELEGAQAAIEVAAVFAQTDPTIMQVFRADEVVRRFGDVRGAPADLFLSPEEFADLRQQQAQAAAAEQGLGALESAARSAKDLSRAQAEPRTTQGGPGG